MAGTFVSVSSCTFVDYTPWCCRFICPFWVWSDSGKWCWTVLGVIAGHGLYFPDLMTLIHISFTENPAAVFRYWIVWLIDGRLYTLFACSFFIVPSAKIIHNVTPFGLHPWRMGDSIIAIETVLGLWIVTPSFSGWKIVVYPSSDILLTLTRVF